ncbi:sigma-70 family RNA polymerase sigma factor [Bacillus sp. FSL K6-3431]|uniref:sigma-70 family RNA polymerase sigma factor n=1 Tax=Bacillus sp. FSL K6-3431 TaxID=2921500 RepID=UPI0030FB6630
MARFEDVVEEFRPMIYHIIKYLHIYKDVEEYFQTGMIALWDAQRRFEPDKGTLFSTYAFSYIKGRIMTDLSNRTKMEERNVYPEESFWETAVDNGEQPLQLAILLSYCTDLTEKQKQWVVYTFYYGMTIQEIAGHEKVSPSAVKKWRIGAIPKLKKNVVLAQC